MQLEQRRTGTRQMRRIASRQIGRALKSLHSDQVRDVQVHAARKELKKARATLRLVRDGLGSRTYRRENAALRDVARPLSRVRDGKVLLETLQTLIERIPVRSGDGAALRAREVARELRTRLLDERRLARAELLGSRHALDAERRSLKSLRRRAADWPVGRHGWSVLGPGLLRVYRKARRGLAAATPEAGPDVLHEWRKQTKYLWHELQLLQPLAPATLQPLARQAQRLGELLGDYHDLEVLRARLADRAIDSAGRQVLLQALDAQADRLRQGAVRVGARLYARRPRELNEELALAWRRWQRRG